jgi:hypothetical protein
MVWLLTPALFFIQDVLAPVNKIRCYKRCYNAPKVLQKCYFLGCLFVDLTAENA